MPNPENLRGKGNRFSSTNQPKSRGRKPSIFKKWAREYDISEKDVKDLMLNLTFAYTVGEVKKLIRQAEDGEAEGNVDQLPLGVVQFLSGSINDINKGNQKSWWQMLDRAFGKPEKTINHELGGIDPDTAALLNTVFCGEPKEDGPKQRKPRGETKPKGKSP